MKPQRTLALPAVAAAMALPALAGEELKPRDLTPVTWMKAATHPPVEIVRDGQARAAVYVVDPRGLEPFVPERRGQRAPVLRQLVDELLETVRLSTGATLEVVGEPPDAGRPAIVIGDCEFIHKVPKTDERLFALREDESRNFATFCYSAPQTLDYYLENLERAWDGDRKGVVLGGIRSSSITVWAPLDIGARSLGSACHCPACRDALAKGGEQLLMGQFLNTIPSKVFGSTSAGDDQHAGAHFVAAGRYSLSGVWPHFEPARLFPACNLLSWWDGAKFAAWAGLRPMSELEYEKACRGPLKPVPDVPDDWPEANYARGKSPGENDAVGSGLRGGFFGDTPCGLRVSDRSRATYRPRAGSFSLRSRQDQNGFRPVRTAPSG